MSKQNLRETLYKRAVGKGEIVKRLDDHMTKWRTDAIYFPRDLNLHDPDNKYQWREEEPPVSAWVWAGRALFAVGFLTGIYCLVFLGMLL